MSDDDRLRSQLHELREEVGRLRSALARLESSPAFQRDLPADVPDPPTDREDPAPSGSSRRQWLRRGAVAVGAGLVVTQAPTRPAAAANGDPVKVGESHTGTASTRVSASGVGADALFGEATATTGPSWGVRGVTHSPVGFGVYGLNLASTTDEGAGVRGQSLTGGRGVSGISEGGSLGTGVNGTSHSLAGTGVHGVATNAGTGVVGFGQELGGSFSGNRGALNLQSSGPGPLTSSLLHQRGDLYRDDAGGLWLCTETGRPGSWVRLTAPTLYPVTPFRAYDSRFGDGPLARGANRLVSVRDAIDVVTGKVVTTNAVPSGATAIMFNLAVTNTVGGGFLAAAPGGATKLTSASINWTATGQTFNNGTFVRLDGSRRMRAFADGTAGARTDFVVDVTAYLSST